MFIVQRCCIGIKCPCDPSRVDHPFQSISSLRGPNPSWEQGGWCINLRCHRGSAANGVERRPAVPASSIRWDVGGKGGSGGLRAEWAGGAPAAVGSQEASTVAEEPASGGSATAPGRQALGCQASPSAATFTPPSTTPIYNTETRLLCATAAGPLLLRVCSGGCIRAHLALPGHHRSSGRSSFGDLVPERPCERHTATDACRNLHRMEARERRTSVL